MKQCKEVCDKCKAEFIKKDNEDYILKTITCGYKYYDNDYTYDGPYGSPPQKFVGVECGDLCPICIEELEMVVKLFLGIKE